MGERAETVRGLDAVLRHLRHDRYGLYGTLVRERFLTGLAREVTPTAYRVLRFIEASTPPPPSVTDIADLLMTDRPRAVRVVDQLTDAGLVARERDAVDHRIRRVSLTDSGRQLLAEATARRVQLLEEALAGWPDEDLAHLTRLLGRLNDCAVRHVCGSA